MYIEVQQKELQHAINKDAAAGQQAKDQMLRKAMALVKTEKIPTSPDEAHMFLQEQVGQGEMLFKSGTLIKSNFGKRHFVKSKLTKKNNDLGKNRSLS